MSNGIIHQELEAVGNVIELPGNWPSPDLCRPFEESEGQDVAKQLMPQLEKILLHGDKAAFEALYWDDGFWRDQVALSWSFRTFYQKSKIVSRIPDLLKRAGISEAALIAEQVQAVNLPNGCSILRVPVAFKTTNPDAKCHAIFKFVRLTNGDIKLFTTTTALVELGAAPWKDFRNEKPVSKELPSRTDVLVIGGGHGGICFGAYLSALKVDFAILDREATVGDAWAKRYDSATLHTTRVFSGLPYVPFPNDYPEYVHAKLLAKYYQEYVKDLNLPIYQNANALKADWDESKKEWTVESTRGTVVAKALVFAIGIGGRFPIIPNYPGKDTFKGEQLHSVEYTNPEKWKGKKIVVIGASTTGLDVAWDCSKEGMDVTLIQRSPTRIYAPEHIKGIQSLFWNEKNGAELGDIMTSEDPVALQEKLSAVLMKNQTEAYDPAYYSGLKKAGFLAQTEGSVHNQIFCHGGKHYPDIGAMQSIIDGEIKVKSAVNITRITEDGLDFEDGTHMQADVICYCTGFKKDTRDVIASIIGKQHNLEPIWGLDKEGEVRGTFRPTGVEGVWMQGGELQLMRYCGKQLAMQVAAVIAGVRPEPVRT